jgi:hypothetical protein
MRVRFVLCFCLGALPLRAETPLSAIDWLDNPTPVRVAPAPGPDVQSLRDEAPVAVGVVTPDVSVMPIGEASDRLTVGLLPATVTGLPETLWEQSDAKAVQRAIEQTDLRDLSVLQKLYYTMMLAEAVPPSGMEAEAFLTVRAGQLRKFGAIEPAEALVERLPLASPQHFALWFDLTLLAGLEDKACIALNEKRGLSNDYAAQIFCALRGEDWDGAALLFDTADALGLLSSTEHRLLLAFLDPEYAEDAPSLAPPRDISALEFRLYEAVGNPLPTASLPIAYAVSDLRDLAGWKAQIEAAERLVRNGALSANALLGLYTERKPAASGGVWERVRAVQNIEAALVKPDPERLSQALQDAHYQMADYGLTPALAEIYAPEIAELELTAAGDAMRFMLTLMSDAYETARVDPAQESVHTRFMQSLAAGTPEGAEALNYPLAEAIEEGFDTGVPDEELAALMAEGKLGEAILLAAEQMTSGLNGNMGALKSGIAAMRQMGLEDITRRASLQMMLKKPRD